MAAVASARENGQRPASRSPPGCSGVVGASTLVTCCRKWSAQNWPLYQTTPSPNTRMVAIRTNLILALRKMHPDIVGDEHQQEREQERDAPAPVVERGLAEIGACCDDDEERQYDSEGGRGLQPASVVPDAGRLRVVVRQLVPVLRHRQHPHGAERGNHRDIHDNPHGPIPQFTQWENCVSLPGVPGGSGNPAGVAFRQRKRAFVLSDEPILLAKGIVMQASRWPVREHRHSILRHIVR